MLKIKVCGIRSSSDVDLLSELNVDYVGLNFIDQSVRRFNGLPFIDPPIRIQIIGIFQNHSASTVLKAASDYRLDGLQFHGNESNEYLAQFRKEYTVIKTVNVATSSDLGKVKQYTNADIILLDSKSTLGGGSGRSFDWRLLECYQDSKPFFIAGGICPDDAERINAVNHPNFMGIDINSRFEITPGVKDMHSIDLFIKKLQRRNP